jgi:hypothetical protein
MHLARCRPHPRDETQLQHRPSPRSKHGRPRPTAPPETPRRSAAVNISSAPTSSPREPNKLPRFSAPWPAPRSQARRYAAAAASTSARRSNKNP